MDVNTVQCSDSLSGLYACIMAMHGTGACLVSSGSLSCMSGGDRAGYKFIFLYAAAIKRRALFVMRMGHDI